MISAKPTLTAVSQQDKRQVVLLESGLRALGRLAEHWALTDSSQFRFVNGNETRLSTVCEHLERVSHLLGIYRAATVLFRHREASLLEWLRAANTAPPFAGLSPLEVILDGRNLNEVRGYLECQLVA